MSGTKRAKVPRGDRALPVEVKESSFPFRKFPISFALFALASVCIALILYRPVLDAPFLFDDFGLPFAQTAYADKPVGAWVGGVRPMLMLSYWVDFQRGGHNSSTYHLTNLLIHCANSVLVSLLCVTLLRTQSVRPNLALVCGLLSGLVFLIHPLQTESVAYLAGRSELVCGLFTLCALALFCWKLRDVLSWKTAAAIHALYIAACLSKEQAAVLPALLLGMDVVFGQRSVMQALKRGVRVYVPIAIIGAVAVVSVFSVLTGSASAGFGVSGFQWYEYAFTQPRVWLMYIRLAMLPVGQNADYDIPLAHSFFEPGTILPLVFLLIAALLAWRTYRTAPIVAGGLFVFAMLLVPTSSIIPIQDVAAERRMYLPLFGLLLASNQVLVRVRFGVLATAGLVGFVLVLGGLTFERTKVWGNDLALWSDITAKSPNKVRGYTHLALAYLRSGRCSDVIDLASRIPSGARTAPEFMGALGRAYACEQRMDEAVKTFEYAANKWPSRGRLLALASVYSSVGRFLDAEATEEKASLLPPQTPYDFLMMQAVQKAKEGGSRARSVDPNRGGRGL